MIAEYKRDLQHNYLILELPEGTDEEEYRIRMAQQNEIQGLLTFHSAKKDGRSYLHYEITSRQSLKDVYAKRSMNYPDMLSLLTGIEAILENMQKYLLNPAQLVFDPQYMYLEPGRKKIWLCYFPGAGTDCGISILAEFILKRLDHEEQQAVVLGYSFYQKALEENFSLQQTLKELLSSAAENDVNGDSSSDGNSVRENLRENQYEESDEEEEFRELRHKPEEYQYRVTHKKRSPKKKKGNKIEALFQIIHPAVLLSGLLLMVLLEVLFYLHFIYLTEAGGLFFLFLSVEILINKSWRRHNNRKQKGKERWPDEEDDESYQELREEMYQNMPDEEIIKEEIEETRYLTPSAKRDGLMLKSLGQGGAGKVFPDIFIGQSPVIIGKIKGESDILLDSPTVSRMHACLEQREEKYYLKDLNSKNGTFYNERRLHPQEQCEIVTGDHIRFAEISYEVVSYRYYSERQE